jgi:hypothetical protein
LADPTPDCADFGFEYDFAVFEDGKGTTLVHQFAHPLSVGITLAFTQRRNADLFGEHGNAGRQKSVYFVGSNGAQPWVGCDWGFTGYGEDRLIESNLSRFGPSVL